MRFDLGVATLSEFDADGFIGVSVARYGGADSAGAPFEVHHPFGFFSRPMDPDVDGGGQPIMGCTVLYAEEGDKTHAWLGSDPRYVAKVPKAPKGSAGLYCAAGSALYLDGSTGSFQVVIPYANGSKTGTIAYDCTNAGAESLMLVHGDGMAITMMAGSKNSVVIKNKAGDAYIEINDDGIILNGNVKVLGGAVMGGAAALPVAIAPTLAAWLTGVLIPALASAAVPIVVAPPPPFAAINTSAA